MRRACGRPLHVCNMAHVGLAVEALSAGPLGATALPSRLYAAMQGYRWLGVLNTLPPDPLYSFALARH